jgi:DNA adenine methylase
MNAGMIGGRNQAGTWKLDARFNKRELERRIREIAARRSQIGLSNKDAVEYLTNSSTNVGSLVYLDPPYFNAGRSLYLNAYEASDHAAVSKHVRRSQAPWIVSYDDVPEIRRLYATYRSRRFQLLHTAREVRVGREVMFFCDELRIPRVKASAA